MQNVSKTFLREDLSSTEGREESIESQNLTIDSGKVRVSKSDAQFDFR